MAADHGKTRWGDGTNESQKLKAATGGWAGRGSENACRVQWGPRQTGADMGRKL